MICIDDEEVPSINGTGAEDYFNHAWGMQRKLIYIVKNAVKAEAAEAAKAVTAPGAELIGGLKTAKEIIEKNHGKFVVAMDGNIFKTGILINMVQE